MTTEAATGGVTVIRHRESRRYQFLQWANAVKDEEFDSPFFAAVSEYAASQSWLPDDIALLSFATLARAVKGQDMRTVSLCLDELCVDVGGAA